MSDRIEGAANETAGGLQRRLGGLTGDAKTRFEGITREATGKAQTFYAQAVDAVEAQLSRAPAQMQEPGRKAVTFARERPIATVAALGALALLLTRGGRRRH